MLAPHLLHAVLTALALLAQAGARPEGDGGRGQFAVQVAEAPVDPVLCPTEPQLTSALEAQMPGVAPRGAAPGGARALRLTLTQATPVAITVALTDAQGALVLERVLDVSGHPRPSRSAERTPAACAALADTVALIVERYLREIGYRPNPAPNPAASPPAVAVVPSSPPDARAPAPVRYFVGVGSRVAAPFSGAAADARGATFLADLTAQVHLRRIAFSLAVGLGQVTSSSAVPQRQGGTLQTTPMPLRLGAALPLAAGPGVLLPGVAAGADVLWIATSGIAGDHPGVVIEPVVEAGAAYLLPLGRRFYGKLAASAVLNLQPHDFALTDRPDAPYLSRTARGYARAGIELGVAFGN